uniref:CSON011388 protein n=1 Tax=Culicoides sonorensis TaxID=179676 RepID=A0A336M3E0_CULSO
MKRKSVFFCFLVFQSVFNQIESQDDEKKYEKFGIEEIESNEAIRNNDLKVMIHDFFNEQNKVSVMDDNKSNFSIHNLFPFEFPTVILNSFNNLHRGNNKGSIKGYNMLHGYICVCTDYNHCFNHELLYLSTINPLANIVLITDGIHLVSVKKFFANAWKRYKMLNILIVNTKNYASFIYNPFNSTVIRITTETKFDFHQFHVERTSNLYGYPLKINVFDCLMLCRVLKDFKYELACSEILYAIKRLMNITLEYVEPSDKEEFGYIHPNGTYMGALGEIEYNRVDIAVDLRIIAEFQDASNLYFLKPAFPVKFCFVVPNNFYPLTFEVFPHKFVDNTVLFLVIFSMFTLIVVTYTINTIQNPASKTNITNIALSYFSIYNNVSTVSTPTNFYGRLLYATMLLFTIIMANSYQGSIITQLNRRGSAANIDTIQQLLTSGLAIRVPSGPDKYIRDFESFPRESTQRQLFDKKIITDTSSKIQ